MTTRVRTNKTKLVFGRNLKAGREEGKLDSEKGKVSSVPCLEAVGPGKLEVA